MIICQCQDEYKGLLDGRLSYRVQALVAGVDIWPFSDVPRFDEWFRTKKPVRRIIATYVHPAFGAYSTEFNRNLMHAFDQAAMDYGTACGLLFRRVTSASNAELVLYLDDRFKMGSLGKFWSSSRRIGISPVGHDGKRHPWKVALRLIQHEIGHYLFGSAHDPNPIATMNVNVSADVRYPSLRLPGWQRYGTAGLSDVEASRLRAAMQDPIISYVESILTPKADGGRA